jgi:hypothetical protein
MLPDVKFNPRNKTFTTKIVMESNKYTNSISTNSINPNINIYVPEYSIYRYKLQCITESLKNINIKQMCMYSVCNFYEIDKILIEIRVDTDPVSYNSRIYISLTFLKHKLNNPEFRRLIDELEDIKNDPRNFINLIDNNLKNIIGERYNYFE